MTDPRKPILVLTTGGTIDKTYFDAQSSYQVGASQVRRLLELGRVTYPFEVAAIMRKDSLDLDDADRAAIVARVRGGSPPRRSLCARPRRHRVNPSRAGARSSPRPRNASTCQRPGSCV